MPVVRGMPEWPGPEGAGGHIPEAVSPLEVGPGQWLAQAVLAEEHTHIQRLVTQHLTFFPC